MMSDELRDVLYQFGRFFYEKHDKNRDKASAEIERLCIHDAHIDAGDKLVVVTERPGLLIGRRGEQFHAIAQFIGRDLRIEESPNGIVGWMCYFDWEKDNEELAEAANQQIFDRDWYERMDRLYIEEDIDCSSDSDAELRD